MEYPKEARKQIAEQLEGKTIKHLEYVEAHEETSSYWVVTFEGEEFEFSFKFMAELVS